MTHEKLIPTRNGINNERKINSHPAKKISRREVVFMPLKALAVLGGAALLGHGIQALANSIESDRSQNSLSDAEMIKKIFGINPQEYGFTGKVPIKNNSGKFLLHIGQLHLEQYSDRVKDPSYLDAIATQQKLLESLLLSTGFNRLFVEGINPEFLSQLQEKKRLQKNLESLPIDSNIWETLKQEFSKNSSSNRLTPLAQFTEYIFVRQAAQIQGRINAAQEALRSTYNSSEQINLEQYGFPPGFEYTDIDRLKQLAPPILPEDYRNAYAFIGAPLKMYADGAVDILPTSTEEEDSQLTEWLKKHEILQKALINVNNPLEQMALEKQLDVLETQFQSQFVQDKETNAIERILGQADATGMDIVPFVLGYGHDLTDQLVTHNQQHPSSSYGLMTLIPQGLSIQ